MPVVIRGKPYVTVAERLRAAHADAVAPKGIASVSTHLTTAGDYVVIRDGRRFAGHAEVTRGDGSGAQGACPVETAETSAVGRALAMAGWWGSPEGGIAGAEEVQGAESRSRLRVVRPSGR
jgi:hypothetical protein